ncbi:MAG: hypothetical protein ACYTAF_09635 [Planctomycetota bacterium]|jgi:hypothetical protein
MGIEELFGLAFLVIVALSSIFGPLIQRMAQKKQQEALRRRIEERKARGEEVPEAGGGPATDVQEAKLPFEGLAEELFGDYIQRRKTAHRRKTGAEKLSSLQEAQQQAAGDFVVHEVIKETPQRVPSAILEAEKRARMSSDMPSSHVDEMEQRALEEQMPSDEMPSIDELEYQSSRRASARRLLLDDRVFKGRRLRPVARAIVYGEIFGRCRAMGRFRPGRF